MADIRRIERSVGFRCSVEEGVEVRSLVVHYTRSAPRRR